MEITLKKELVKDETVYCIYHGDKYITIISGVSEDSAITRFNEHVKKMQLSKFEKLPKIIKSVTI